MKKFLSIVLVLLILVAATGCTFTDYKTVEVFEEKLSETECVYPFYESLTEKEKELYASICNAVENFEASATVIYNSEEECQVAVDGYENLFRGLVYEQAQYFWLNPYECTLTTGGAVGERYKLTVGINYIIEKEEAEAKKEFFDKKVDEIVKEAEKKKNTFDKVLYVYDTIISNTKYDHALAEGGKFEDLGISAYGCLIEGRTICSGYVLAFNHILSKLGFECGAEFNNYDEGIDIFDSHVWSYCLLDGDYYYFDPTFDDTIYDSEDYKDYIDYSHHYFAITSEELALSQTLSPKASTPECNGTKYNYYVYNGFNISDYSYNAVCDAIKKQAEGKYITLRFGNYRDLLRAETDFLKDGDIFDIVDKNAKVQYTKDDSGLHLDIFIN